MMLLTVAIILVILWLVGLLVHVGGAFINLVLLLALIVFIWDRVARGRDQV